MNINEPMNQHQWISIVGFEQVNFSFGIIVRIPPPPLRFFKNGGNGDGDGKFFIEIRESQGRNGKGDGGGGGGQGLKLGDGTFLKSLYMVVLFGWMGDYATFDVLFYLIVKMELHMPSLGTLVPGGPWCVFYARRRQVYWGLAHIVVFYWYSDLISHTDKHSNTQHTQGGSRLTHTYKYKYLNHLLCARSSYLCYIKWLNE